MYAVMPNGACRIYVPDTPLQEGEVVYEDLPQFALDFIKETMEGHQ